MSVKGLLDSEKKARSLQRRLEASFNSQLRELREEIRKVEYLLGDRAKAAQWANSPADAARVQRLISLMNDTERLYLEAGDSRAARIFKQRMERQLRQRLTNLKANELEVVMRVESHRAASQPHILGSLTDIKRDGALRELYSQARGAGGFLTRSGRGYMRDLVTLETKAAGSKTLGEYMSNLYNQYEARLKDVFVKGIVRGDSYKMMEDNLVRATDITKGKARLLVRTEANAIFNESIRDVIDSNPLVKGYRFRAVLDRRTSKTCQKHDGNFILKEDVKPGINFPPLHPNCRSTVTTVLFSENERKDIVQRYTKNNSNQWVPVPPGMKYPEFKRRMSEFLEASPVPKGRRFSETIIRQNHIDPNDPRITLVGPVKIVPNVPASAAMLDNKLGDKFSPAAQAMYDNALREEPRITDVMIELADKQGTSLSGIEFSAKTGSSVAEKIERKREELPPGVEKTDEEILASMGDLVRYTVMSEHDDIVKMTEAFMKGFKSKGYTVVELDNKYLVERATYKGVHLGVVNDAGQIFEVQVHSERSLKVKNINHKLYKEAEKVTTPPARKAELEKQMIDLASTLPNPKNIEKLKSFRRK